MIEKRSFFCQNLARFKNVFVKLNFTSFFSFFSDELAMIKAHNESAVDVPLDIPEQFLLDLSGISNFNERLECFMFQSRFADSINEIENRLHNIKHVCDVLLNSTSMKQIFR